MDIAGKTALVTGGSRGIGRGIALRLAEEGVDIAVNYNVQVEEADRVVKQIKEFGRKARAIKADVSKSEEVNNLVKTTNEYLGHIDILVNNAGVVCYGEFLDISEAKWDQVMDINLKGIFLCSQIVAKDMIQRKIHGRIINLSSIAARVIYPGIGAPYVASKTAILGLTRAMAVSLGQHQITVNAIEPGTIETELAKESLNLVSKEYRIKKIPIGRLGKPEDIAGVVAFLASEDAKYITGETILVDGGFLAQAIGREDARQP